MHCAWLRFTLKVQLSGRWTEKTVGIGSNGDSFFEYLLKHFLLFGHTGALVMFEQSYSSVYRHLKRGDWYAQGDIGTGVTRSWIADGLQTFWPGLQVRSVLYCFGL